MILLNWKTIVILCWARKGTYHAGKVLYRLCRLLARSCHNLVRYLSISVTIGRYPAQWQTAGEGPFLFQQGCWEGCFLYKIKLWFDRVVGSFTLNVAGSLNPPRTSHLHNRFASLSTSVGSFPSPVGPFPSLVSDSPTNMIRSQSSRVLSEDQTVLRKDHAGNLGWENDVNGQGSLPNGLSNNMMG